MADKTGTKEARPPQWDKKLLIGIRFTPAQKAKIEADAKRESVSFTEMVRRIIDGHYDKAIRIERLAGRMLSIEERMAEVEQRLDAGGAGCSAT